MDTIQGAVNVRCPVGHGYLLMPVVVRDGIGYYNSDRDVCRECGRPTQFWRDGEEDRPYTLAEVAAASSLAEASSGRRVSASEDILLRLLLLLLGILIGASLAALVMVLAQWVAQ